MPEREEARRLHHDGSCELGRPVGDTYTVNGCDCAIRGAYTLQRDLAQARRMECWWCGRSPSDEPAVVLTRLNPKGLRGVFECQLCRHSMTRGLTDLRDAVARLERDLAQAQEEIAAGHSAEMECDRLRDDLAQAREVSILKDKDRLRLQGERDHLRAALAELRPLLVFFGEKWRWFLRDGDTYHAAFLADVRALARAEAQADQELKG